MRISWPICIAIAAAILTSPLLINAAPEDPTPQVSVSIRPVRGGYIPAGMANGRPVYIFNVFAADVGTDLRGPRVVSASTYLQAGDAKRITRGNKESSIRAFVELTSTGTGTAGSYRVEYVRDGKTVVASAATLELISE